MLYNLESSVVFFRAHILKTHQIPIGAFTVALKLMKESVVCLDTDCPL